MKRNAWLFLPLLLSACTTGNWYEGVRQNEIIRCQGLPDAQREKCLEGTKDSYEEYKRKRDEATSGK